MQALVGLFCFSLLLATGTCLECEHCSGFNQDCTGKLNLCNEGQDTCATILTETIIGKVSSFTIVKSCYQASKCLSSSKGNSFMKVNVNIECSTSPARKMESEGGKAPVHWSNELPNNQLLAEVFNRPKSRAAVVFNPNPSDIEFKAAEEAKSTDPRVNSTDPTGKPSDPPVNSTNPTGKPTDPTGKPTDPAVKPTNPPVNSTDPPVNSTAPTVKPTDPPVNSTDPPINSTDPSVKPTDPPVNSTDPPVNSTDPSVKPTDPPVNSTGPPVNSTDPTVKPTDPPVNSTGPPVNSTDPPVNSTDPTSKTTDATSKTTNPPVKPTDPPVTVLVTVTTGDNAHQTVASFLLALSSLLLMNIFL